MTDVVYVLFHRTNYSNPFADLETNFEAVHDEKGMEEFSKNHKMVDRNSYLQGYYFEKRKIIRG